MDRQTVNISILNGDGEATLNLKGHPEAVRLMMAQVERFIGEHMEEVVMEFRGDLYVVHPKGPCSGCPDIGNA